MSIIDRLMNAENLPSLPTVALEVLRLAKSDDVSVDAIARVIQNDPALTAKLLRVVNSPLFGVAREVASIKQATVILGLRAVKAMALSFSLVDALRVSEGDDFDLAGYWKRSVVTSVAARLLARETCPRFAEEAFVAGLLSDIGLFVGWRCLSGEFRKASELVRSQRMAPVDAEVQALGQSHAALGKMLLERWRLPEPILAAVGAHHGEGIDLLTDQSRTLGRIAWSAARLASLFTGEAPPGELQREREQITALLAIEPAKMERLLEALTAHVRQTAMLLSLNIGATISYAELQAAAATQLAEMSVQAEVERARAAAREDAARAEAARLTNEKNAILELAATDSLTKIANRAAFDHRCAEMGGRPRADAAPLGVIMLDIDHFKKINDTYGHRAGDEVLRCVASRLQTIAGKAGFVARYGGEEFAVLTLNQADEALAKIAEEVRSAIQAMPVLFEGKRLSVTASLGVARARGTGESPAALIEQADQRLYAAKRAGRNRVQAC